MLQRNTFFPFRKLSAPFTIHSRWRAFTDISSVFCSIVVDLFNRAIVDIYRLYSVSNPRGRERRRGKGEEEGGCSRDIRWDKSYYRGQVAWPVRGNLRRCQNGWPAYEHGNHIRLKPHCLMDAICLNPIIRPQFITAYPFLLSILFALTTLLSCYYIVVPPFPPYLQPEMSIGGRGEGDILHSRSSLQRSRNIFARGNFNILVTLLDPRDGWEIFSL